jgi:hypothetical protein
MVEAGTRAVLEAIEHGGIANWLDAVRAYDDRIYQHSLMVAGLAAARPGGRPLGAEQPAAPASARAAQAPQS